MTAPYLPAVGPTAAPASRRRRPRGWYWLAVLLALLAVAGGTAVAVRAYSATGEPADVVRAYFAAVARGDAPGALAWGPVPAGDRSLLTSTVLAEQRELGPIRGLQVLSTTRDGAHAASVDVSYEVDLAAGPQQVTDSVGVVQRGGRWELAAAAVSTRLRLRQAGERAAILGAPIPDGAVLLFPGALPITFDTPYLQVTPSLDTVGFGTPAALEVDVGLSDAGRAAVLGALTGQLRGCLQSGADPRCPLPSDRVVPGSLRGTVDGDVGKVVTLTMALSARGAVALDGEVLVSGTWQGLSFENVAQPEHGELRLPIAGTSYLTPRPHIVWQEVTP